VKWPQATTFYVIWRSYFLAQKLGFRPKALDSFPGKPLCQAAFNTIHHGLGDGNLHGSVCPSAHGIDDNAGLVVDQVVRIIGKEWVQGLASQRTGLRMSFTPMKLKPESGANRIRSADDAYSFMAHLRLSYQSKPHWQAARQALDNVCASNVGEIRAWRTFRAAVSEEGWLID
jgi:hypothetical protein